MPARARVGGDHELEAAGQLDRAPGASDRHPPVLERLSQRLERVARNSPQLVEEEDAAVGERDLPRPRRVAATDQARGRDRVMRGPERARAALAPRAGARRRSRSRITSSASAGSRGGRIDGSRRAASDLPAPGGPTMSRLWPPAAAISSARRSAGCPLQVARGPAASMRSAVSEPGAGARAGPAPRRSPSAASCAGGRPGPPRTPPTSAASGATARAHHDPARPRACRAPRPSPGCPAPAGSRRRARARRRDASRSRTGISAAGPRRPGSLRRSRGRSPARPCAGPQAPGSP